MTWIRKSRFGWMTGALVVAAVVAGCSSGGSSTTSTTLARREGGGATEGPEAGAEGPSADPGSGSAGTLQVDLVFTGDRPAQIKGDKGYCDVSTSEDFASRYDFTGADYPSLGADGAFSVNGPQGGAVALPASLKAIIDDGGFLDTDGSGITFSADGRTVTLDADLSGSTAGGATPLSGHVTGTITCP